jgi:phage shock protein A
VTETELLRRARLRIGALEAEVERLERALKSERQRAEEWKLRAQLAASKGEAA